MNKDYLSFRKFYRNCFYIELMIKIDYQNTAKEIRKKVLKMIHDSQASHTGSALSCIDILTVLYSKTLRVNPENPWMEERDRFILSKGHAVSALYAVLALREFFPEEILDTYCMNGKNLPGHSTKHCVPGVEVSVGSLGHGLAMGAGMAIAAKNDKKGWRVFVLLSDGECQEGSVWETAMFASHHKLDNLVAIVDYNKLQALGRTNEVVNLEPLLDKWVSFGWAVKEVEGHNHSVLEKVFSEVPFEKDKPSIIIAHTVKGKGVSFMENKLEWHYKSPNKEEIEQAMKELNSS